MEMIVGLQIGKNYIAEYELIVELVAKDWGMKQKWKEKKRN